MKTFTRLGLATCLLLSSFLLIGPSQEQTFAAKPAPPPSPPLPPVRYRIQYWTLPTPVLTKIFGMNGMNNLGQIVGWYINPAGDKRAYLYDPEIDPEAAVDLENTFAPAGIPEGWKITAALGINNQGLIVGYLSPVGSSGTTVRQAYILDVAAATPQVVPLPNWNGWDSHYAWRVNDNGDILAAYENADGSTGLYFYNPNDPNSPYFLDGVRTLAHLNNPVGDRPAQVGGTFVGDAQTPFRWTPQLGETGTLEIFGSLSTYGSGITGINDAGTLCGTAQITTTKPKGTSTYPFRLGTSVQLLSRAYGPWASINSSGDVLLSTGGGIYRDDWSAYGNYADIDQLVVGTEDDLAYWACAFSHELASMNDRGSLSNAGQISGRLFFPEIDAYHPFLLIPIAP